MKRWFVVAIALSLLGSLGCERVPRIQVTIETSERASLRLGVLPTDDDASLQDVYQTICDYLSSRMRQEVQLVLSPAYEDLGYLLRSGKAEIGWFSSTIHDLEKSRMDVRGLAHVVRNGSSTFEGVILVREDSGIDEVADLRGRSFGYVSRYSGSGFQSANQILRAAGLDPLRDLGSVEFTTSHLDSLKCLVNKDFDAVAVFAGAIRVHGKALDLSGVRELARSRPISNGIIAVSSRVKSSTQSALKQALIEILQDPEGKQVLEKIRERKSIDGFVEFEEPGRSLE